MDVQDRVRGRDVQERKNKELKNQILVLAPSEGIVPADTWLAGKMKCGHCGRALKSLGNRADNMSCMGCGTLWMAEYEQFVYEAMVHKLSEFQTLTAKAETVNPKPNAESVSPQKLSTCPPGVTFIAPALFPACGTSPRLLRWCP